MRYFMIAALVLMFSCTPYERDNKNQNTFDVPNTPEQQQQDAEQHDYNWLTSTTFSINGGGRVSFTKSVNGNSGQIIVKGGRADLKGDYRMSGTSIRVFRLKAVSGSFDASNNRGSSGSLSIKSNGTIYGTLSSGIHSRSITLTPY